METSAKITVELTEEEAANLETLFEVMKALASPTRLALVGALASHLDQPQTLEQVAESTGYKAQTLEQDLRQLRDAGIIQVREWRTVKLGWEPQPWLLSFNLEYLKLMPQLITTINRMNRQITPNQERQSQDDRARTLARFMQNGRIVGWPAQLKRQVYLLEEAAKLFEAEKRYSEREVDTLLKKVYEDHCTLRRYLVDFKFLQRENGIYWKV